MLWIERGGNFSGGVMGSVMMAAKIAWKNEDCLRSHPENTQTTDCSSMEFWDTQQSYHGRWNQASMWEFVSAKRLEKSYEILTLFLF